MSMPDDHGLAARWKLDLEPREIATPRTTRAVLAALGLGLAAVTLWGLMALGAIPGAQASSNSPALRRISPR